MNTRVNIRAKGQMTLPAEVRRKLGAQEGSVVYLRETRDGFEIVNEDKVVDPAAGMLAQYAKYHNPDPADERAWLAQNIADMKAHPK